eukprot:TRINITY_DN1419_c0_g1_i1.p1 TRINITY_DN1419_c0_g1~~TRINITY_DN1419_c0_g1_i1.p1  ORF type:complete len:238 (-),score=26.56 TRINITY_DN1419_c0_g1_i1:325-1038(-)
MDITFLLNHEMIEDPSVEATLKRRNVSKACLLCRKSHLSCDLERPCSRCIRKGLSCEEGESKRRGRKRVERFGIDQRVVYSSPDFAFSDTLRDFWLHVYFTKLSLSSADGSPSKTIVRTTGISTLSTMILQLDDFAKKDSSMVQVFPPFSRVEQFPEQTQQIMRRLATTTFELQDRIDVQLGREIERFNSTFDQVNCPAMLYHRNAQILCVNSAMRELTGFTESLPTPFEHFRVASV